MGKLYIPGFALICGIAFSGLTGCGNSNPVKTVSYPVPTSITLAPTPAVSMQIGTTSQFTAAALNSQHDALTEPLFYQTSDPTIVTVASNGLACAGSWDSTTVPTVCTPGRVGVAKVYATAQGVVSAVSTVYVHEHIDQITLTPGPNQQNLPCQSVNNTYIYQASATSSGVDITSTVGQFSWIAFNNKVAALNNTAQGLLNVVNGVSLNQVQVTAETPGTTPIFATVGTATSLPISFITCAVQSIVMQVLTSSSSSQQITPIVTDTLGTQIPPPNLTYSSTQPGSVTVSSDGAITNTAGTGGAATVVASCTPPDCNVGFMPSQPVYPQNVVSQIVPPGSSAPSGTVYVSSTGCTNHDDCFTALEPITYPANTLGTLFTLPAAPNSMVFSPLGNDLFTGTRFGILSGGVGLTILNTGGSSITSTQAPGAPGKVLAVSPDTDTVIISDTVDTPNQLYIYTVASNSIVSFSINGATAASFSPDSLKAFIAAGNQMYVSSKLDPMRVINLTAPANDVAFLPEGAFGFLAGGSTAGVTGFRTCDLGGPFPTPSVAPPQFIRPLLGTTQLIPFDITPNYHFLALDPPNIEVISISTAPTGCTPTFTSGVASFNLGQGNFIANQFIVSEDGSKAFVISPSMNSVPVFNTTSLSTSSIGLTGSVTPVAAALTPDGGHLYVAASDGNVHVLDTNLGADILQITFPQNFCLTSSGQNEPYLCKPDLIAVKP
jgi:hypothetical protein